LSTYVVVETPLSCCEKSEEAGRAPERKKIKAKPSANNDWLW